MIEAGIIDPAKVTRSAVENAASIAAMMLTTEALITDKPEPEGGSGHARRRHGPHGRHGRHGRLLAPHPRELRLHHSAGSPVARPGFLLSCARKGAAGGYARVC